MLLQDGCWALEYPTACLPCSQASTPVVCVHVPRPGKLAGPQGGRTQGYGLPPARTEEFTPSEIVSAIYMY